MKALIVDDESRVRKAIRLLVQWETHGITDIEEAANGLEAMELIPAFRPSLVLMDMLMPLKTAWISWNGFIKLPGYQIHCYQRA